MPRDEGNGLGLFTFPGSGGPLLLEVELTSRMADVGIQSTVERVYREMGHRLWRAVYAYSRSAYIADEAVAEAFAQALRQGAAIRDHSGLSLEDGLPHRRGRAAGPGPNPSRRSGGLLRDGGAAAHLVGSGKLSHMQRAALVLHYYGGYRAREIALMLRTSPAADRVHLMRGRRRLRVLLERASQEV